MASMWKITLPYAPGTEVWIPECNPMGTFKAVKCTVHHYVVGEKTEVALYAIDSHKFKFVKAEVLCLTEQAAFALGQKLKAQWAEKKID